MPSAPTCLRESKAKDLPARRRGRGDHRCGPGAPFLQANGRRRANALWQGAHIAEASARSPRAGHLPARCQAPVRRQEMRRPVQPALRARARATRRACGRLRLFPAGDGASGCCVKAYGARGWRGHHLRVAPSPRRLLRDRDTGTGRTSLPARQSGACPPCVERISGDFPWTFDHHDLYCRAIRSLVFFPGPSASGALGNDRRQSLPLGPRGGGAPRPGLSGPTRYLPRQPSPRPWNWGLSLRLQVHPWASGRPRFSAWWPATASIRGPWPWSRRSRPSFARACESAAASPKQPHGRGSGRPSLTIIPALAAAQARCSCAEQRPWPGPLPEGGTIHRRRAIATIRGRDYSHQRTSFG